MGYLQREAKSGVLSPNKAGNATKASMILLWGGRCYPSLRSKNFQYCHGFVLCLSFAVSMAVAGFLPEIFGSSYPEHLGWLSWCNYELPPVLAACIENDPKSHLLDDWLGCVHQKLYIAIGSWDWSTRLLLPPARPQHHVASREGEMLPNREWYCCQNGNGKDLQRARGSGGGRTEGIGHPQSLRGLPHVSAIHTPAFTRWEELLEGISPACQGGLCEASLVRTGSAAPGGRGSGQQRSWRLHMPPWRTGTGKRSAPLS